jgi:hypothetical protein
VSGGILAYAKAKNGNIVGTHPSRYNGYDNGFEDRLKKDSKMIGEAGAFILFAGTIDRFILTICVFGIVDMAFGNSN